MNDLHIGEEPGALLVKIATPKKVASIAGWAAAVAAWGLSMAALLSLLDSASLPVRGVSAVLWGVPGLVLAVGLLYRVFGRERVRVTKTHLELRLELFGLGRTERIALDGIRDLRHFPDAEGARLYGLPAGGMAFDAGGGTRWFGEGVTPDDAQRLIAAFSRRFRR